jgi:hypothetical protein
VETLVVAAMPVAAVTATDKMIAEVIVVVVPLPNRPQGKMKDDRPKLIKERRTMLVLKQLRML